MVNSKSKEDEFVGNHEEVEGLDDDNHGNQETDQVGVSSRELLETSDNGFAGSSRVSGSNNGGGGGLTERLREILSSGGGGGGGGGEEDQDLVIQQSEMENNFVQWLQALDVQLIGACRADERLKPLLKLNVSSDSAEDHLLAHLSQHFDAQEVGMLARCLCVPLVSIRVGKVIKEGSHLCPTASRGNLNLTLLPSSDLRISFVGDDGLTDRLAILRSSSESSAVVVEEIPADSSGRSFLVQVPGGQVSYFWCSEKSKLIGAELLGKMKDLLGNKPSLAKLTGISESRLDCFAIHLRAYLGSAVNAQASPTVSSSSSSGIRFPPSELESSTQVAFSSSEPSYSEHNISTLNQESLCVRSNPFSDCLPSNLSSFSKEKLRLEEASGCTGGGFPAVSTSNIEVVTTHKSENKLPEASMPCPFLPFGFLESVGMSATLPSSSFGVPSSQTPASGSLLFSPYYCWSPPCTSSLLYTVTPPHLPITMPESLTLPPLSSLLSAVRSSNSLIPPNSPLSVGNAPSLDLPGFVPDPMFHLPLPVSSFIAGPSSQHIPTFTPLMCDPIVHIPVMDVCSSGQGYLVSAGSAISTIIPPLHPNMVNPLIPQTESMMEKSARETLRLLLGSTQVNPQLMQVFPAVLTSSGEKSSTLAAGSRGMYSGTIDVDANAANPMVSFLHGATFSRSTGEKHECGNDMEISPEEKLSCVDDDVVDGSSNI